MEAEQFKILAHCQAEAVKTGCAPLLWAEQAERKKMLKSRGL
jgi:hypothetical protein